MPRNNGGTSRTERYVKAVRAKAHREGTVFKVALDNMKQDGDKIKSLAGLPHLHSNNFVCLRRGRTRNNFIQPTEDEGPFELRDEDVYDFKVDLVDHRDTIHYTDLTVSLLDIARPAKRKGVAKDFEVVRKTRNVVPLDDAEFEIWEDDVFDQEVWGDWEQIYDEQRVDTRQSYSSVLRGHER